MDTVYIAYSRLVKLLDCLCRHVDNGICIAKEIYMELTGKGENAPAAGRYFRKKYKGKKRLCTVPYVDRGFIWRRS